MPRVIVKIPAWLSQGADTESAGFDKRSMTVGNLKDVFDILAQSRPGSAALRQVLSDGAFTILLNDRYIGAYAGNQTELKEHDEITLVPLLDGG